MKINSVYDYIDYRLLVLNNELLDLKHQFKANSISMKEINYKIKEIRTVADEGFFMFSPIAAEEDVFNKQEIKDLQMKLIVLSDNNNEIKSKIDVIQKEIKIISSLRSNDNKTIDKKMLVKSLEFIISIIDSDFQRAKLELAKLLVNIENEK